MEDIGKKCHHCRSADNLDTHCNGHVSGILSRDDIMLFEILNNREISKDSLQATSYDLRLGEGHCIYKGDAWVPVWISQEKDIPTTGNIKFTPESHLIIEPFGAALIQLKETVNLINCTDVLDNLVCGRFDLKLALVAKGLISQQATQVEPLYYGKLFCYLFNMTGDEIALSENDRIATIEFYYASCRAYCNDRARKEMISEIQVRNNEKYKVSNGELKTRIYCNEHGIDDVRYFLGCDGEHAQLKLPKHGGLSVFKAEFDKLKKTHEEKLNKISIEDIKSSAKEAYKEEFGKEFGDLENRIKDIKTDFGLWVKMLGITVTIISLLGSFFVALATIIVMNRDDSNPVEKTEIKEEVVPAPAITTKEAAPQVPSKHTGTQAPTKQEPISSTEKTVQSPKHGQNNK